MPPKYSTAYGLIWGAPSRFRRISRAECQPINANKSLHSPNSPLTHEDTNSLGAPHPALPYPPLVAMPAAYISSVGTSGIPPALCAPSSSPPYSAGSGRSKCSRMRLGSRCKSCHRCDFFSGFCRDSRIAGRERDSRWRESTSRSTRREMSVSSLKESGKGFVKNLMEFGRRFTTVTYAAVAAAGAFIARSLLKSTSFPVDNAGTPCCETA